jgi:enoyl-CoA hydratase
MCLGEKSVAWTLNDDVHDRCRGRAFCAGGDIQACMRRGARNAGVYGQQFWADEYRMNAPSVPFPNQSSRSCTQFTMGGSVGVGCWSHRIVDETSRIAMPECGIGLVPDVGGSHAGRAGRLGECSTTGTRMGPGDAIYAGLPDYYVPDAWDALKPRYAAQAT